MCRYFASSCLAALLLAGCATRGGPSTDQQAADQSADRRFDCSDVNGPIGMLILTKRGEALIKEPNATETQVFGSYEERVEAIVIHNQDFGAITYRKEAGKLISVAADPAATWSSQITCLPRM